MMETNSGSESFKHKETIMESQNLEGDRVKWMLWENQLGSAFDNCFTDVLIKGASGMMAGMFVSALLTRRRTWPVFLGTGFGVGLAYTGCEKYIKTLYGTTDES